MNTSIDYSYLYRLACYTQRAVSKGAFLSFNAVFKRFKKATKTSLGDRQQKRYREELKNSASNFGLKFVMASGKRGKVLYVTSSAGSYFNQNYDRETPLAHALLQRLHTSKAFSVKVYDTLLETTKLNKQSLEKPIRALKSKASRFGLIFIKIGSTLHAQLIYPSFAKSNEPKLSQNTPQNYDIAYVKNAKDKEIKRNTAHAEVRFSETMRRKAFWIARQLAKQFYDNCKVKLCMPMLVTFAQWAIQRGFEDRIIEGIFNCALLTRHADATDMGLNQGWPGFKFEMTSTVSLARTLLLQRDDKTSFERWHLLKAKKFSQNLSKEIKKSIEKLSKESMEDIIKSAIKTAYV